MLAIGHVLRSWFSNACAPSLAVAARSSSRFSVVVKSSGLGSEASRRPRSKVYGVGLLTTTWSFGAGVDILFGDS